MQADGLQLEAQQDLIRYQFQQAQELLRLMLLQPLILRTLDQPTPSRLRFTQTTLKKHALIFLGMSALAQQLLEQAQHECLHLQMALPQQQRREPYFKHGVTA